MTNAEFCQRGLKECWFGAVLGIQAICELRTVVCLNTLNCIGELLNTMFDKFSRRIGAVFLECFQVTKTAEFVNEGILIITTGLFGVLNSSSDQAGAWHILDVDLNSLARILHLFVLFGNIFGICQLYSPLFSPPQNPIETLSL